MTRKSSGTVIERTGDLRATIKFFAWADADQMPIKSVCVDFGTGDPDDRAGTCGNNDNFYKNKYGYKTDGTSACNDSDFGRSSDACEEDPFTFNTTYTCTGPGSPGWEPTCPPEAGITGGCCVFVPKVQVLDNWGWCNGTCRAGGGCYNASWKEFGNNECDIDGTRYDPWTYFGGGAGKIIVVPR